MPQAVCMHVVMSLRCTQIQSGHGDVVGCGARACSKSVHDRTVCPPLLVAQLTIAPVSVLQWHCPVQRGPDRSAEAARADGRTLFGRQQQQRRQRGQDHLLPRPVWQHSAIRHPHRSQGAHPSHCQPAVGFTIGLHWALTLTIGLRWALTYVA